MPRGRFDNNERMVADTHKVTLWLEYYTNKLGSLSPLMGECLKGLKYRSEQTQQHFRYECEDFIGYILDRNSIKHVVSEYRDYCQKWMNLFTKGQALYLMKQL